MEAHVGFATRSAVSGPLWELLCFMQQNVAVEKLIFSQPIYVALNRGDVVTETLGLNTQFTAKCKTNLIKKGWREIRLYLNCLYRME